MFSTAFKFWDWDWFTQLCDGKEPPHVTVALFLSGLGGGGYGIFESEDSPCPIQMSLRSGPGSNSRGSLMVDSFADEEGSA